MSRAWRALTNPENPWLYEGLVKGEFFLAFNL